MTAPVAPTAADIDAAQAYLNSDLRSTERLATAFARHAQSAREAELAGVLEALEQALHQFTEPMSAFNGHELGERLASDVREIVDHAHRRTALIGKDRA